jgi:hypothetical protein
MLRETMTLLVLVVALGACERPRLVTGETCEINSDCAEPLVCVLSACRIQCVDSRDCGAGLRCLRGADTTRGGGCQQASEVACDTDADCMNEELLCQDEQCVQRCRADRDCVDGQYCGAGADGVVGCLDRINELCIYNTDCPAPLICDDDQICRFECVTDRDCIAPRVCSASLCMLMSDGGT